MLVVDERQNQKIRNESQILYYIAEQIISLFCSFNRAFKIQVSASTNTEATYPSIIFYSNASDASKKLPSFSEPNFYASLVQQAITDDPSFDQKQELRQFNADINRHREIKDDGKKLTKQESAQLLEKWSMQISEKSGIPLERVKHAISTLHQGVGNNAVGFLQKIETMKRGQRVILYRPLFSSPMFHSSLTKHGQNIAMQYVLPVQLITESEEETLDPNDKADLIVISTVNITLDENYMRLSDSVSHSMQLTPKIDGITLQYDNYRQFDARNRPDPDDFVIVDLNGQSDKAECEPVPEKSGSGLIFKIT